MAHIRREIDLTASPEHAFALLTDLDRLPEWATIVVDTRDVSELPLRAGCTFRQTVRVMGRELESEWKVTELEPERLIAYEATSPGGGSLAMKQSLLPENGGTRVVLEIDYELPGGFLGELLDRAVVEAQNEREAERSLQRLKPIVERVEDA
jgi:uncharacterized protein YndB with AHSA1/START domain